MKIHKNKKLQKLMIDKDINSVNELADYADVGYTFARHSLDGKHHIQIKKAIKFARAFGMTVEEMFDENENEKEN